MHSSSRAREGEKGQPRASLRALQGVGDEAMLVATVNTCPGVVSFEPDPLNPLPRR